MLVGGISPYSKVVALRVANSSEILWCFKLEFFSKIFVRYFTIKVSTNRWNLFYNAKSSKYHSTKKQPLPSILSLYNLWGWFLPPSWFHRVTHSTHPHLKSVNSCRHRHTWQQQVGINTGLKPEGWEWPKQAQVMRIVLFGPNVWRLG